MGKRQQVKYQGEFKDIWFSSIVMGIGYLWVVENNTLNTTWDAQFDYELNNMRSEGDTLDGSIIKWKFCLKPGDKRLKRFLMIDPT